MSWMQRVMSKFGYEKAEELATEGEFGEALTHFAEGTGERDQQVYVRGQAAQAYPVQAFPVPSISTTDAPAPAEQSNPLTTTGAEPLCPTDFAVTMPSMPSPLLQAAEYEALEITIDEPGDTIRTPTTVSGWSPDSSVLTSACDQFPILAVVDRIDCSPERQRQEEPTALERLLGDYTPTPIWPGPMTPVP